MRLATRLFASSGLLVTVAVVGSIVATDLLLRRHLETDVASDLEREARLVAALAPADSTRWPNYAGTAGRELGRRVTLIDGAGRVRGDTEFDRLALTRLENHGSRPEVRAALNSASGVGRDDRLSVSTNERQLYVAVRQDRPGLAIVRVSVSLAAVDAQVHRIQRAVAAAGLAMLIVTGIIAWLLARAVAQPLIEIAGASRAIAAGRPATFPDVQVPELAEHVDTLRTMHRELDSRFGELRREREESRTLVEALSDGVLAADARGAVVSANAAARRLLGYGAADPLPPLGELFHDRRHRALMQQVLAGAVIERSPLDLAGRSVLMSARPLAGGRTLLVLSDVTELRRLETVRRDFVANVSHELKTPLTAIAGYAETLAAEAATGTVAQFAQTILDNAHRMQRLVDDLLDLSRIESGSWMPEPGRVDLEAAAQESWQPFAERATARGVQFTTQLARDAGALHVDAEALRQIFTNLFDNALRHSPPGGRIRVAAERAADRVVVRVDDSGTGIAAEHLPRIFERFYRVDPGRSREQGGTGLGLAIVKHLVEAHGGWVDAESELGRGTAILLHFPTQEAPVTQS